MIGTLTKQCDYVGGQIRAAVKDLSDAGWDTRASTTALTPREIVTHLCDVYGYAAAKARGEEPKWNQYTQGEDLMADFEKLRAQAIEDCLASADPYEFLTDYIIVHDAYHVGQLCTARLLAEPDWDPYAIYS